MNRRATLVVTVLLALTPALAGCGGDDGSAPAPTPAPGTTPVGPGGATADPLAGADTEPAVAAARNTDVALLTDVRAAHHAGYDRIVFEFKNARPGYDVRYVDRPVVQDGSGKAVAVKGDAVLRIRMENALDADLSQSSAPLTYKGPMRFTPAAGEIAELVRTGAFEGVLTWAAGLHDRQSFLVRTLTAPPRLVVDVRNQSG